MGERILLVRLGAIGDVIHTLPLAAAIRDAYPSAEICWAAAPGPGLLLEGNPDIDRVFTVDTRAWSKEDPLKLVALARSCLRSLRSLRADIAVDAQGLIKSGIIVWASGAGTRVGFDHSVCREGLNVVFTTHWAPPIEGPHHVVEKNLSLLAPLGIEPPPADSIRFPLMERAEEGEGAASYLRREGLAGGRPLMIMHPGAGWETKRWEAGRYAVLGDAWLELSKGNLLITWGPGEEETARRVAGAMRGPATLSPPTDIRQFAALIRRSDVFTGGDTGPLHLAAALGVRCLALFGPTDPGRNGPWGEGHAVLHRRLACSGCYGRICPDVECLDRIGENDAIRALRRLWEGHEKSG